MTTRPTQANSPASASSPQILMMCGLPFAGKSTLVAALARLLDVRVLSMDALNTERGIGIDGTPISSQEWAATYAETYRCLRELLAGGGHRSL